VGLLLAVTLLGLAAVTFLNGFHDASNAVSSAVRTRALSPRIALAVVAAFTAAGTFLSTAFGTALMDRVESFLPPGPGSLVTVLAAVVAAGSWSLLTWWRGQPSSSTHALLSGLAGAGFAAIWMGLGHGGSAWLLLLRQVLLPMVITALIAPLLAYLLVIPVLWLVRYATPSTAHDVGRSTQAIGASAVALAHGVQDGQRAVATTAATIAAAGYALPRGSLLWLEVGAAVVMAAGVLCGGWRITHTLSTRLLTLDPLRAGVANAASAVLVFVGAVALRLPVSSSQAVVSALVGAGLSQGRARINWATARRIALYWALTPLVCATLASVLMLAASPLLR